MKGRVVSRERAASRGGFATIPSLILVSGLAVIALALLRSGVSSERTAERQEDEYRLTSAVESAVNVTVASLWSGYLASQGGEPGTIASFRAHLQGLGIPDSGPGGMPAPDEGTSLLGQLGLAQDADGSTLLDGVHLDALRVVRRDEGDATRLFLTASARSDRGHGTRPLTRAVSQVWTVEPANFDGFDYALLANEVNCIFCHTRIDSVERYFDQDPAHFGTFDRVRVGTLETLMVRHVEDGQIDDFDADSYVAGTLYARGLLTDHDGAPITDWEALTLQAYAFDGGGKLVQDAWGELDPVPFQPAGTPLQPLENLYVDYPEDYAQQVDGNLPEGFPSPIPDDGGIDPATGAYSSAGAGNKIVDDAEFLAVASEADGSISGGAIAVVPSGETVETAAELALALAGGSGQAVAQTVEGHLVLQGTEENPILIDGTVAVDGDVVISGWVKGEGSLVVRGNVYMPSDVQYADGKQYLPGDLPGMPTGPRTFGIAQDGTVNALGVACGGNVMIGDYLAPATLQADLSADPPGEFEIVTGAPDGEWSFGLAEMSLFNRMEWAKTQPFLPAYPGQADEDPSTWTLPNPSYEGPDYVPRYYHVGEGDAVPIYNKGDIYWDAVTGTWKGDAEVPLAWDESKLTIADPSDPSDPVLYGPGGTPKAVLSQVTATGGWLADEVYELVVEHLHDQKQLGDPLRIDGLVYTNNSVFALVGRGTKMLGRMVLNGSIVAADVGMLVPGFHDPYGLASDHSPGSAYAIGLQLNYDARLRDLLNVPNPLQVTLQRTLWTPAPGVL